MTFAILVGLYIWAMGRFLGLSSPVEAIGVGLMWMVLTIIFEFALGRYVVGDSWGKLIADYDILEGKVWGLFILWVGLALRLLQDQDLMVASYPCSPDVEDRNASIYGKGVIKMNDGLKLGWRMRPWSYPDVRYGRW